jgi:PTH1 family peptidyl-tRNA hydrolase
MGLFQRRENTGDSKVLYTLGLNKTVLVVGLGNMGAEYQKTRHNAGFMAVEAFAMAHSFGDWTNKKDLKCIVASGNIGDTRVILCKPTTMMNLSGESVQAIMQFYKLSLGDIVAVYDELEVDFGRIRCRVGGGSAGHNGVKSLIKHLGEDFGRVRVGIGPKSPPQIDSADFVLQNFTDEEQKQLELMKREVTAVLTEYVSTGELPHDTRSFI